MAAWPLVSMARGQLTPSWLRRSASLMTFLYPRLKRWCWPPKVVSMYSFSPSEVMESVTTVPPGLPSKAMAEARATRRLRLISSPWLSTAAPRSTSVSKMTPRSAPEAFTAWQMEAMAVSFSGLGMWLGNMPSGSKNWLPEMSAPRGSSTSQA